MKSTLCTSLVAFSVASASLAQAQPVNDDRLSALEIKSGQVLYGTNRDATIEVGEPNFGSVLSKRTVWWKYKANASGIASIIITSSANWFDFSKIAVDVFAGSVIVPSRRRALSFAEKNGFGSYYIRAQFLTTKNGVYFIRVGTGLTASWPYLTESSFNVYLNQHGSAGGTTIMPRESSFRPSPIDPPASAQQSTTRITARRLVRDSYLPDWNYTGYYMVINTTKRAQLFSWRSSNSGIRFVLENNSSTIPASFNRISARFRSQVPGVRFVAVSGNAGLGRVGSYVGVISTQTKLGSAITTSRKFPVGIHRYDEFSKLSLSVWATSQAMSAPMRGFAGNSITIENRSNQIARGCRILEPYHPTDQGSYGSYSYTWRREGMPLGRVFDISPASSVKVLMSFRPHYVGTNGNIGISIVCNNHAPTNYSLGMSLSGTIPN